MKKTTPLLLLLIAVLFLPGAIFAGEVIKVGVPLAMTGPYADTGENYWRGIKMAIDEINANGGLLGKQLVPIRFDTQEFSPERVMQGADYLVGKEKVASVHAGWAGWGQEDRKSVV